MAEEALLERSEQLSQLADALATVAETGSGRIVVVSGEAGIGKTSLVRRFCHDADVEGANLWGSCDVLFTPRPLGPLLDIAETAGGEFGRLVRSGAVPYDLADALAQLFEPRAPGILVFEDVHSADEATLDVLRLLARRLERVPALVIATYRDVGLDRWHPLRVVLGEIAATSPVLRLRLAPLTLEAVAELAARRGRAAEELHRTTGGNPFFVTEALAGAGDEIPETVRNAVLGRAARLGAGARLLLDAIAVAGSQAELPLLEALAGDDVAHLDEALASGIVVARRHAVGFSHELARLAVEESIPLKSRLDLHRAALAALEAAPGAPEPSRLAHHAQGAGDAEAVLRFAPLAAQQAAALGAHREAAIHYEKALALADLVPLETRAALFAARAFELFLTLQFESAGRALEEARYCFEELGDRRNQGAVLSFLAQMRWLAGNLAEATVIADAAIDLLDEVPALVEAYLMKTALLLAAEDEAAATTVARRCEAVAGRLGDPRSSIQALQALGWVEFFSGRRDGLDKLARAIELAEREGLEDVVAVTYVIVVRTACRLRMYDVAEPYVRAGLDFCSTRDYDVWRYYLLGWQSRILLTQGRWTDAAQTALICLGEHCPFARGHALVTLGLVRARRGDPDAWAPLDEALELAVPRKEMQWIAQVAIARAEAAWLEGRPEAAIAETDRVYLEACRLETSWAGQLGFWRRLAGDRDARAVARAGAGRYEAALAQIDGGDDEALRRALAELQALGARPAAAIVARKLRERGSRSLPRGQRPATRANPGQLTARELEVVKLVAEGLRNAEIADRLFLSERTVAHHVSAILRKLGVPNRVQAVTEAVRLGIVER